jgi:hypothetical protein
VRLPRPRFTVRLLMLVVALSGLAMGGGIWGYRMWRLSREYKFQAQHQRMIERGNRAFQASMLRVAEIDRPDAALVADRRHDVTWNQKDAEYAAAMARKYERAARYPWLPFERDPRSHELSDAEVRMSSHDRVTRPWRRFLRFSVRGLIVVCAGGRGGTGMGCPRGSHPA